MKKTSILITALLIASIGSASTAQATLSARYSRDFGSVPAGLESPTNLFHSIAQQAKLQSGDSLAMSITPELKVRALQKINRVMDILSGEIFEPKASYQTPVYNVEFQATASGPIEVAIAIAQALPEMPQDYVSTYNSKHKKTPINASIAQYVYLHEACNSLVSILNNPSQGVSTRCAANSNYSDDLQNWMQQNDLGDTLQISVN